MTLASVCTNPPVLRQPLKLLVFAHTPPPLHGQSYMIQLMLEGFGGNQAGRSEPAPHPRGIACYHVNARFSEGFADIGGFRFIKLWLILGYFVRALWYRVRHGVKTLYYVPAPPQRMPVLRDWLVLLLCRPFFPRRVLHWHSVGLGEWLRGRGPLTRWLTRAALGRAQLAIVLAEVNCKDAAELAPERIALVRNGIPDPCPDFERQWRVRRRERAAGVARALDDTGGASAPKERIRVLFIALCTRDKGLFDALAGVAEANARLAAAGSAVRFELHVAGDFIDREERAEFERIIAAPEWSGMCCYHGFVTGAAKKRLFAEADLLVFPSYYYAESFGLVVAEAMAWGLPVIATRWRAIPEVLPPGYPYLVEPRAPGQIADALLRAARDREPADLRGRFAREFTLERHLDALAEALHQLDAPRGRAGLKIALSALCENPERKTGLTSLFHELVARSLKLFPEVSWVVFIGPDQQWFVDDARVEICRDYPANNRLVARLWADHLRVPAAARRRGADVLLTVGFVPVRKCLPTAMHILALHHLDKRNRVGWTRSLYRRWMTRCSWPRADLVITNSRFAQSQILAASPKLDGRIMLSYEGLQHERFHPAATADEVTRLQAQFGLAPNYFLWISNFYPYKQVDLLVRAYARLAPELRRVHPLVMVGGDWGNRRARTLALASELGVADDVKTLGWVHDDWLAPLYRQALAFCLASREETFGRCVLEAMACGTPCVVNDIPVMREVTGGHAVLIDYHDTAAVANVLEELVRDTPRRRALGARGVAWAANFSFERLATERVEAIRRLRDSIQLPH